MKVQWQVSVNQDFRRATRLKEIRWQLADAKQHVSVSASDPARKFRKPRDLARCRSPKAMMSILAAVRPLKACRGSDQKIGDRRSALDLAALGHTMFDIMGGNFVARRPPHALVTGNVVERLFQILMSKWRINHEGMKT